MTTERRVHELGERVGAYQVTPDGKLTLFFGFGNYIGDAIPPQTVDWQSFLDVNDIELVSSRGGELTPEELRKAYSDSSPVIALDNGEKVFGIECWWRPEREFEGPDGILSERPVRRITVADYRRKQYEISDN